MSDDQPRGRRLTAEARRAQIVAVATALIAQHGFHNVTIQQIADACGIVKTAVIRHFPSKPDILVAVLETRDAEDAAAAGFDIHHDPQTREAFFESLDRTVTHNFERRELLRLYTVLGAESLNPDHPAHDYFLRRQRVSTGAIRDAAKSWHPAPEAFAVELLSFLDGLQLNWLRDPAIDPIAVWKDFSRRAIAADPTEKE